MLISADLIGCAVAYRHPNDAFNSTEDQQNFDKDRQACASIPERERCVELREKKYMICESDGKGGHKCREVAPKNGTLETVEQCMRGKSWRKADIQGNCLEQYLWQLRRLLKHIRPASVGPSQTFVRKTTGIRYRLNR
jgi:hypothetical protein